jgi:hypothetical protein
VNIWPGCTFPEPVNSVQRSIKSLGKLRTRTKIDVEKSFGVETDEEIGNNMRLVKVSFDDPNAKVKVVARLGCSERK